MSHVDEVTDCGDSVLDLLDEADGAFLTPAARELLKDDPIALTWQISPPGADELLPRDLDSIQGVLSRNDLRDISIAPMASGSCCCCTCTPCCCCAVAVVAANV
jgi:hypothetical protein